MDIRFDLVKKLTKPLPKAKGITLRSLRTSEDGQSASAILMAGGYQQIREDVESYRMLTGLPLSARSKGRSLELTSECGSGSALVLMDFLKGISFNSEDVMETIEFFGRYLGKDADSDIQLLSMDMTAEDLRISCFVEAQEGETPENVFSYVSSLLDRYDMGIIKEEPAEETE
ncbi:MAG: hypothetical protein J6A42_09410 [Firmicutes bacterium]|nr:hypothetical protein [Bacillota bacterium]